MNDTKIFLPFCRTLLSQSAGSLTMSSIASYLEKSGYDTELFLLEKDNTKSIGNFIKKTRDIESKFIIAKINFQDYHIIIPLLEQLKKNSSTQKVALCGPYASMNYHSILLNHKLIDAILVGYPEISALEFVQFYSSKNHKEKKQFSFAYRSFLEGKIINPNTRKSNFGLNDLPFPKRTIESIEQTSHINLEASRGCQFNCSFCHLGKSSLSYRSPESVIKEIIYLNRVLGKTFFIFNDSCFWANSSDNERVLKIANGIIKESLDIRIYIYLRVKPLIPVQILKSLTEAGLVRVFLGVESGVNRIKRKFNKPSHVNEFIYARTLFEKKFNINVHIGFITIEPTSSILEVEGNIDYLMQIEKIFRIGIIIEPMRVIPDSLNHHQLLKEKLIDKDLNYNKVTYGYRFKHIETSTFLQGVQEIFRYRLRREAYKFEYYSTVVGLLKVLTLKLLGSLSVKTEHYFEEVLAIRARGMSLIHNYLKCHIAKFKRDSCYIMSESDTENSEFIKKFRFLSVEIEIAYSFLVTELEQLGCGRAINEIYTGMEAINA